MNNDRLSSSGAGYVRWGMLFALFFLALVWAVGMVGLISAENEAENSDRAIAEISADLTNSAKKVNRAEAEAGSTIRYTIALTNTGSHGTVAVTDTLPAGVTFGGNFVQQPENGSWGVITQTGVITWEGFVGGSPVMLSFDALLSDTLTTGTIITNTALIDDGTTLLERSAMTEIVAPPTVDLSGSSKRVDLAEALPGQTIRYTIVVSNTGVPAIVSFVDTLPEAVRYVAGSIVAPAGTVYTTTETMVSWRGLAGTEPVEVIFDARLERDLAPGTLVTNSVVLDSGSGTIVRHATTTVLEKPNDLWLPIIMRPLEPVVLSASRPNSTNQWGLFWQSLAGVAGYEIQESKSADFATITAEFNLGQVNSQQVTRPLSPDNSWYYRARAVIGGQVGPWSNVVEVVAGYRDDFNDPSTGWAIRRTTLADQRVRVYYGAGDVAGNLVMIVDDRWDWGIGSPMRKAPAIPYAVEFYAKSHNPVHRTSGNVVLGGDWVEGTQCPPPFPEIYTHANCFNQFYAWNFIIEAVSTKLQHETVNELVWCPECTHSPMKRIATLTDVGVIFESEAQTKGWNTWRIEMRNDGAHLFVNGTFRAHLPDTQYFNQPYFGVFATVWNYKPSIWLYDWFQVVPLD
jgi:uncharacterized repeat protein (TIGR01451 family)